jgi:hypothetical protein
VQEKEEAEAVNRAAAVLAGIAFAACLLFTPAASGATLLGDYQFQGTLASSGPGPSLGQENDVVTYQTENVMGTSRKVAAFPEGAGLYMQPVGFTSNPPPNSVVMTFRLLDDTGYNRILDWSAGTADNGIYDHGRKVDYYRPSNEDTETDGSVFGSNNYSTLAVTMAPGTSPLTRLFVNGTQVLQSPHVETDIGGYLKFFVDNSTGGFTDEESAGAVSCIRVYDGVLTDAEVAAIGAAPDCKAHPAASQPPAPQAPGAVTKKKCKKHKKHRSAESAKKKCKKKKKR